MKGSNAGCKYINIICTLLCVSCLFQNHSPISGSFLRFRNLGIQKWTGMVEWFWKMFRDIFTCLLFLFSYFFYNYYALYILIVLSSLISGKRKTHKLFSGKRRKSRQVVGMDTLYMGPSYMRQHVWHMFPVQHVFLYLTSINYI